jgi:uncharacterized membrane protein YdjX (TVP38/TMEM64 family)
MPPVSCFFSIFSVSSKKKDAQVGKMIHGFGENRNGSGKRNGAIDRLEETALKNRLPLDEETRKKRRRGIVWLVVFLLFWLAVGYFLGKPLIQFVSEPERFRVWVEGQGTWGKLALVGMMALQVVIAVIPCEALEIGAGYAFGMWEGAFLCLAGLILGSVTAILFTRKLGVRAVELIYSREKIESIKILNNRKRLDLLIFFLFLIPGTPKDLMTYLIGLTRMRITTYVLITSVARFPSVITSTIGGNALWMHNYRAAIVVFAITVFISLAGLLLYQFIEKKRSAKTSGEEQSNEDDSGPV